MSRELTPDMAEALAATVVQPVLLVEGTFAGGTINWWTGIGPLDWDGKTWTGAGDLLGISEVEETDEIKAGGVTFTLSAVKPQHISLAMGEMQRGLPGKVWLALVAQDVMLGDPSIPLVVGDPVRNLALGIPGGGIVADPKILFRGRLDGCSVQDGGETSTISLTYQHELVDLERPREVRYTDAEQKRRFPGDRGLENIAALQDAVVPWGFRP
jgi:hypothetical protein